MSPGGRTTVTDEHVYDVLSWLLARAPVSLPNAFEGSLRDEEASAGGSSSVLRRGRVLAVRPEGANHLWRKNPPRNLSIDPEAGERLGRVTGGAGASRQRWLLAAERSGGP
jgi:hypothetical protein